MIASRVCSRTTLPSALASTPLLSGPRCASRGSAHGRARPRRSTSTVMPIPHTRLHVRSRRLSRLPCQVALPPPFGARSPRSHDTGAAAKNWAIFVERRLPTYHRGGGSERDHVRDLRNGRSRRQCRAVGDDHRRWRIAGLTAMASARSPAPRRPGSATAASRSSTRRRRARSRWRFADRWWITYNGELYNFRELRRESRSARRAVRDRVRHRGPAAHVRRRRHRRCCSGSTASSRSRSGTTASAGCSSLAIGSASSRSTTRARRHVRVRVRDSSALLPLIGSPTLDPTALADYLTLPLGARSEDGVRGDREAPARPLRVLRATDAQRSSSTGTCASTPEERPEAEWAELVRDACRRGSASGRWSATSRSAAS